MPNAETGELPTLAEGATCLSHTSVGSDPKVIRPQALCILGVALLGSRTFLFLLSIRSQMLVATLADILPHCWGDGPHQATRVLSFSFSGLFRHVLLYLVNVNCLQSTL